MGRNKLNFSKQQIDQLKPSPDGVRLCYYDTKVNGLELCVTPTGVKTFSVLKWVGGRTRRVVLGRYEKNSVLPAEFDENPLIVLGGNPSLTVDQARHLALEVISELSAGRTAQDVRRHRTDEITLGALFEEYLEKHAKEHCKSWKAIEYCFYSYLGEWKNRSVGSIKRTEVQSLINRVGKERGQTTANRTLELLRAIINKGRHWMLVKGDNPAAGITKFKTKPRARFLYEHELPRLNTAIEAEENPDIRDYVLISLYTGARKSNVLSMRWEYVDLEAGTWNIPDTKNGTAQTILLTDKELAILRRRHSDRKNSANFEFVFPGRGASGYLADPKKGWQRILKRAGISDLHLHDLRRSLGSYMAMTGASLSVIGNALNHKDVSTTRKVYAHSAREAERRAREIAHARMFGDNTQDTSTKVVHLPTRNQVEF